MNWTENTQSELKTVGKLPAHFVHNVLGLGKERENIFMVFMVLGIYIYIWCFFFLYIFFCML